MPLKFICDRFTTPYSVQVNISFLHFISCPFKSKSSRGWNNWVPFDLDFLNYGCDTRELKMEFFGRINILAKVVSFYVRSEMSRGSNFSVNSVRKETLAFKDVSPKGSPSGRTIVTALLFPRDKSDTHWSVFMPWLWVAGTWCNVLRSLFHLHPHTPKGSSSFLEKP